MYVYAAMPVLTTLHVKLYTHHICHVAANLLVHGFAERRRLVVSHAHSNAAPLAVSAPRRPFCHKVVVSKHFARWRLLGKP